MKTLETPAVITSISSRQDGSLRFSTETPEYSNEEKTAFFELQGKNILLTIKPTDESPVGEIKVDKDMEDKPLHVRLRNTLWVLWDKKYKDIYEDFESFYKKKMNRWIEDIQNVIPE